MKILLIFPLCTLPLFSGGQVRVWNIAKQLSKYHQIDLICFIRNDGEKKQEPELKEVFGEVYFIKRNELIGASGLMGSINNAFDFLRNNSSILFNTLFSSRPLLSHLYESKQLRELILKFDNSKKYDLFYAETYYGIASIKNDLSKLVTPLILIEQNIESKAYQRQAEKRIWLLRLFMFWDVNKIRVEEEYFWNNVKYIGGLSEDDNQYIQAKTKRDVVLVKNGVDVEFFSKKVCQRLDNEILFVGAFKYFQNVDALRYLLDEIWPKLANMMSIGDIKKLNLRIVGRGATLEFKKYVESKGFKIDENVEDIREAFQRGMLLVAPIRAGSGTNYKIIEAMASHLPVVTTAVGAEGFNIKNGEEMLVGNNADEIARMINDLYNSDDLRTRLAENGYRYVTNEYDWKNIIVEFEKKLEEIS